MDDFEVNHMRQWLKRAFLPSEHASVEDEIRGYLDGLGAEEKARAMDRSWREILDAAGSVREAAEYWKQARLIRS